MKKYNELSGKNIKLNQLNFIHRKRVDKLKKKLDYMENIKTIWDTKDKIKELEHKILINEQQVRLNQMMMLEETNHLNLRGKR